MTQINPNILNQISNPGAQGLAQLANTIGQARARKQQSKLMQLQAFQQFAPSVAGIVDQALQTQDPIERDQIMYQNKRIFDAMGIQFDDQPGTFDDRSLMALKKGLGPFIQSTSNTGKIGTFNPRDYTVESFSKFAQTGNPAVLERYTEKTVDIGGVPHRLKPGTTNQYEPIRTVENVAKNKAAIRSAVKQAEATAMQTVKQTGEQKSNESAWNVYNTAMSGLTSALGETDTGPFTGLMPAVTANQQIAEGAVAAMAPILKQMFRAAGEGTFTDSDQKLLMDMVPTRKDRPEAIEAKLQNIDTIVRAKLRMDIAGDTRKKPPKKEPGKMTNEELLQALSQ